MDEIIYTEDNIPVRTVYASGLDETITKEDLESYFKNKFGCIESVSFPDSNYAFITFTSAASTAKAIYSDSDVVIKSKKISVNAADSWHQPTATKDINVSIDNEDGEFLLLRLNDDCLLHLYTFLNLKDIVNLSETCDRLQELSEPIIKKKFEVFDLNFYDSCNWKKYTLMDIRKLMMDFGHYIQKLTLNSEKFKCTVHSRYIDIVYSFCPNLKQLHLNYINLQTFDYPIDKPCSLNNLTVVQLNKCYGFNDEKLIRPLHLIELIIHHCCKITFGFDSYFDSLKKLETINIQTCPKIPIKQIKKLFASNANTLKNVTLLFGIHFYDISIKELLGDCFKNLKHLNTDISVYDNATKLLAGELNNIKTLYIPHSKMSHKNMAQILHELSINNQQIEELDISYVASFLFNDSMETDLLKLKSLKVLKLDGINDIKSTFLIDCAKQMKQLSVLSCREANISNANVVKIVECANNLIELDVFDCKNVTSNIIENVADVLKQYNDRLKLKLKICYFKDVSYELPELNKKHERYIEVIEIIDSSVLIDCSDSDDSDESYYYNDSDDSDYFFDSNNSYVSDNEADWWNLWY